LLHVGQALTLALNPFRQGHITGGNSLYFIDTAVGLLETPRLLNPVQAVQFLYINGNVFQGKRTSLYMTNDGYHYAFRPDDCQPQLIDAIQAMNSEKAGRLLFLLAYRIWLIYTHSSVLRGISSLHHAAVIRVL
jgi:hypothetical protein